jgi:hypothetical protein
MYRPLIMIYFDTPKQTGCLNQLFMLQKVPQVLYFWIASGFVPRRRNDGIRQYLRDMTLRCVRLCCTASVLNCTVFVLCLSR